MLSLGSCVVAWLLNCHLACHFVVLSAGLSSGLLFCCFVGGLAMVGAVLLVPSCCSRSALGSLHPSFDTWDFLCLHGGIGLLTPPCCLVYWGCEEGGAVFGLSIPSCHPDCWGCEEGGAVFYFNEWGMVV